MHHAVRDVHVHALVPAWRLLVPGCQADGEALVAALEVARPLLGSARAALGQRFPQRRHHGDRRREDAVGALRSQELENDFGAVQHSTLWHRDLRSSRWWPPVRRSLCCAGRRGLSMDGPPPDSASEYDSENVVVTETRVRVPFGPPIRVSPASPTCRLPPRTVPPAI